MSYNKQKTGGANMETQLYQDRFGVILYDDARKILELRWFAETAAMTDDDYMGWLKRYAAAAEQHHAQFLLIDTLAFKHHPGAHTGPWREENIIPQYNRAGARKFAFLLSPGAAPNAEPAPEGAAWFPTGYFDSREQIDRWFSE
jgi:hypothetical protein